MKHLPFKEIDLQDPFFDSLRADYPGFDVWFNKKVLTNERAYVYYDEKVNQLRDFLYLKREDDEVSDVEPMLPPLKRIKVGTLKIDARGTRRGERLIKKIMDHAIHENADEIYVTVFPKHERLIRMLKEYGFVEKAVKRHEGKDPELVLVKKMGAVHGDIYKDYPKVNLSDNKKYVLSIWPQYHTRLFPESILKNEEILSDELIRDISPTNSIHKIYVCNMDGVKYLRKGDLLAIYRTSDGGPARFRSVVTSICTVEEVKVKSDFDNEEEYLRYCSQYSIFTEAELKYCFKKQNVFVIKMLYNIALNKRVTNGSLIDDFGISPNIYWGFFQLTDDQFKMLLEKGKANENYIID